jgi:UDPglucose 6-dehydrogenase
LLVVTEWREFRSPDFAELRAAMRTPVLFDGRNLYDPALMQSLGFEYTGVGRGASLDAAPHVNPRLQVLAA